MPLLSVSWPAPFGVDGFYSQVSVGNSFTAISTDVTWHVHIPMGHISQDSCTSVSCLNRFSSLDAPEGMGAACKTECTPTTVMQASCCRKLRAKPRNQVGQIMFSLKVTAVSRQLGGAEQQHFRLTTCHWMCALQLQTVGAGY